MFSFVLLDESVTPPRVIAARDPIGITTLYQGWDSKRPGAVFFASELKAIIDECDKIISFPPGHIYDSRDQSTVRYFKPTWWDSDLDGPEAKIPTNPTDLTVLRQALKAAVRKRLMSEVPYGVLLSGGLDSSLIASIAARETEKVARALLEVRQKKIAEAQSGPPSPVPGGISAIEYGVFKVNLLKFFYLFIGTQRRSPRGLNCIRSPSVSRTHPIFLLQGRLLIT